MQRRKDSKGKVLYDGESERSDGRYQYRYTTLDKKRKVIYGKTLDELREKEKEVKADIYNGICTSDSDITLNLMFDRCSVKRELLKASTKTIYEYDYDRYVRNTIGNKRMRDIKYTDMLVFFKYLADEQNVSVNSIRTISYLLSSPFKIALRDGIIRCNPLEGVIDEIKKSYNWTAKKRKAANKTQVELLLNFMQDSPIYNKYYNMFLLLYLTGLRVSEMCALRWEDCDFENNTVNVNHNIIYTHGKNGVYELMLVPPKSQAGVRKIPMFSKTKEILLNEQKKHKMIHLGDYDGFVFGTRTFKPYEGQRVGVILKDIIASYNKAEKKNAEAKDREPSYIEQFSCHQLRHLFCSMLCEQGVSPKFLQEIMGHANFSVTMDVYAEFTAEKKQNELHRIENNLSFNLK